jgi:hypothetical protein
MWLSASAQARDTTGLRITELPRQLRRRFDPESGLVLIDPN